MLYYVKSKDYGLFIHKEESTATIKKTFFFLSDTYTVDNLLIYPLKMP